MVAEFLGAVASGASTHARRAAAIDTAFDAVPNFRASDRLTREQMHDRAFLRELDQRHRLLETSGS